MNNKTFPFKILFLAIITLFSLQFVSAKNLNKNKSDCVSITIKTNKTDFKEGKIVKIETTIKNTSNENVQLSINRWDKFYGFPVNLRNERDEKIDVDGKHPQVGGGMSIKLAPNEEYSPYFEFENLNVGVYKFEFRIAIAVVRKTREESEILEMGSPTYSFSVDSEN